MKDSTSEKTSQRSHELERKIAFASANANASVMDKKTYPSSKPITMNQGNRQIIKE